MDQNNQSDSGDSGSVRLTSLEITTAAAVLTRMSGRPFTEERLRAHIAAGAPVNPEGTINLLKYGAWLTKEVAEHGD